MFPFSASIYVVRKIRGSIAEEEPLEKPPCSAVGKSSVYNHNFKENNTGKKFVRAKW